MCCNSFRRTPGTRFAIFGDLLLHRPITEKSKILKKKKGKLLRNERKNWAEKDEPKRESVTDKKMEKIKINK